ncbi:MAG: bifunctional 5,10-methylenetetrahydrofolate dehydrogenase/5,10-methenyltetrahydrofolate cyclohydrolase [Candidatus Saccharibacteria bacterium]|nr:bifunctional 5,10-methylenetetrahydrofolate dehydrogenase/5,10-methenyltetrahydrofolate cyclohydrolase [Candidatus Saccharibacteria bacterium]
MKELNGREIAGYVKERQAHTVKALRSRKIFPKLVIFYDNDSSVIAKYMSLKQAYGDDIKIAVEVIKISADDAEVKLKAAADDDSVTGIIVQLPLAECDMKILDIIPLEKDVDGLRGESDTATAMAIHWLLNSYGVELAGKKLGIVGHGKLVGAPLERMWRESGYDVTVYDKGDDTSTLPKCDIIVTATGVPGLIKSEMLKHGAVVVDAGTASEGGVIKGDLDDAVRERDDLTVTPKIGGVGPLTVAMLFERVLQAAEK